MRAIVIVVITFFLCGVQCITNTNVNTLQQMMNRERPSDLIHRVLKQPRTVGTSGVGGVETLQMIMKTEPLSSREIQTFFGESKTLTAASKTEDLKDRIDTPELVIPVDATEDFDINNALEEEEEYPDIIDIDQEYLYEDIDTAGRGRDALSSAFISNKDPFSLTLSPTSSLMTKAGDLHYITFVLQNKAEVTKFLLTAGVGGVVTEEGPAPERQRMVFPGQVSVVQSLTPDQVLLNTNMTAEITIAVREVMEYLDCVSC